MRRFFISSNILQRPPLSSSRYPLLIVILTLSNRRSRQSIAERAGCPVAASQGRRSRGVVRWRTSHRASERGVLGVAPPSEDGLSSVGDFAPMFVEENFAAGIAEDCDREEVVDEARQSMGEACIGG